MGQYTRVGDADRDRVVEQIEDAFVEGQIDFEGRERRITLALTADTLGDLDAATRHLKRPDRPERSLVDRTVATRPVFSGKVVAIVAAVVIASFVIVPRLTSSHQTMTVTTAQDPEPEVVPEVVWARSVASLKKFRADYEREFSTTEFHEMWIHDDHVYVELPTRDSRNREEGWNYDGEFTRTSPARNKTDGTERSDLSKLNVAAMMANTRLALRSLNVTDAELTNLHVGSGEVLIVVENDYDEDGVLWTTYGGTITDRRPFES